MSENRKKLIIIDDEVSVHKLLKKVLQDKYELLSLYEPQNALETVKREQPHLILLDIMMPDISGIEICQQIKSDPSLNHIKILILSAKDSQDDRIKGLEFGADDYITKPFHVSTLVRKINYILSK